MDNKVVNIYKKCGQTPLECINEIKNSNPELKFLPMTYAGRLDPLAEGVILILVGSECNKKEEYLNLSKEYEVDILFGFSTDTYDLMGLITKKFTLSRSQFSNYSIKGIDIISDYEKWFENNISKIQRIIPDFLGKIQQSYPPYSSRPVKGQPLFKWARDGKLNEINIPIHDVFVEKIDIIDNYYISSKDLLEKIKENISKVNGDFRQKNIISMWQSELKNKYEEKYPVIKLKIICGSGVYMRGIAHEIGKKLESQSLALKIIRTKIGKYSID